MDPLTIVGILILLVVFFGMFIASFLIYTYYAHDQEKPFPGSRYAIGCVVFSLFMSLFNIMIIPFDFITGDKLSNPNSIGIDIDIDYVFAFSIILSLLSFVLNFYWLKYYRYFNPYNENPEDMEIDKRRKFAYIFIGKMIGGCFAIILPMSFIYGARMKLGFTLVTHLPNKLRFSEVGSSENIIYGHFEKHSAIFTPALLNSLLAPLVFVGGFVFYIIGGFGMATVPLKFFTIWVKRPKVPDPEDMVTSDIILREMTEKSIDALKQIMETQEEIDEARQMPGHDVGALRIKIDTLMREKVAVQKDLVLFEEIYEIKKKNHNILDENPLKYLAALVTAIFSLIFSIILIAHALLSMFDKFFILEGILFKLHHLNIIYGIVAYLIISFYSLFVVLQGYESLCQSFPDYLGYNQMHPDRTWLDTWMIVSNLLMTSSIIILSYNVKYCPNFFAFTYSSRFLKIHTLNIEYNKILFDYKILKTFHLLAFFIGIILNSSKGING